MKLKNICQACLSKERKLFSFEDLKIKSVDLKLHVGDQICWECKSLIMKFHNFCKQVTLAQKVLSEVNKTRKFQSFSSLTCVKIRAEDIKEMNYDENENLNVIVIKKEEDSTKEVVFGSTDIKIEYNEDSLIVYNYLDNESSAKVWKENDMDYKELNIKDSLDSNVESVENDISKPQDITEHSEEIVLTKVDDVTVVSINPEFFTYSPDIFPFNNDVYNTKNKFRTVILRDSEIKTIREKLRNSRNYINKSYKCESCIVGFNKKGNFIKHVEKEHDQTKNPPFQCSICKLRYCTLQKAWDHRKGHSICYKCKMCKKQETKLWLIWQHCRTVHNSQSPGIKCSRCKTCFETKDSFNKHLKDGHTYICKVCGVRFNKKTELWAHERKEKHGSTMVARKCEICQKEYKGRQGLFAHMRSHLEQPGEEAFCVECGVQYKNVYLYKQHLKTNSKHVAKEDMKHKCPHCEMRFIAPAPMQRHIASKHSDKFDFKCEYCGQMYKTRTVLTRHVLKKHIRGEPPRDKVCEVCGKAFKAKITLQQHMNTHTGARPYVCVDCGATFSYSGALYKHRQLVHNRDKERNAKRRANKANR